MTTSGNVVEQLTGPVSFSLSDGSHLNLFLAHQQGLNEMQMAVIVQLHEKRISLFHSMDRLDPQFLPHLEYMREVCVSELRKLEYAMQRAWGLRENEKRHTHWHRAPHCDCYALTDTPSPFNSVSVNPKCRLHGDYDVAT